MFKKHNYSTSKVLSVFIFLVALLFGVLIFPDVLRQKVNAQIPQPAPFFPCEDVAFPEFHTYRPYQASPCNTSYSELALYCGSSFTFIDPITIDKVFENPPTAWDYFFEGTEIFPVPPQNSLGQIACQYCVGYICINTVVSPCDSTINQCQSHPDCFDSCTNNMDGTSTCTFEISRHRTIAIDLSGAFFPIMGNTECVINSQNPNGPEECIFGTGFDAYGNPISGSTWQFTDPLKVNEYVSWYLNGVTGTNRIEIKEN